MSDARWETAGARRELAYPDGQTGHLHEPDFPSCVVCRMRDLEAQVASLQREAEEREAELNEQKAHHLVVNGRLLARAKRAEHHLEMSQGLHVLDLQAELASARRVIEAARELAALRSKSAYVPLAVVIEAHDATYPPALPMEER